MPNYLEYQKSIASEFLAYEKRVRYLIDDRHWAEEGRYKEIILMNYLKRILPKPISVGTGFIRNNDVLTSQIDIIIYDESYPLLFSEGDFIVAVPENVLGIIEVKSNIESSNLYDIIKKANRNAEIICGRNEKHLFNGIFSFNRSQRIDTYIQKFKTFDNKSLLERLHLYQPVSSKLYSCVNHIAFGSKFFMKLWPLGITDEDANKEWRGERAHYSFYNMEEGLAFSYFLSNLQERILRHITGQYSDELPETLKSLYYPIEGGKETRLIDRIELS